MTGSTDSPSGRADQLRQRILELVGEYHDLAFAPQRFIPGETSVPVSGRVFDAAEMQSLIDSGLDFWLTTGRFSAQFEKSFARFFGIRGATLVPRTCWRSRRSLRRA
jgi:CDP-6-deoxy-D-xylo-4-hexulose-3-dehydrase